MAQKLSDEGVGAFVVEEDEQGNITNVLYCGEIEVNGVAQFEEHKKMKEALNDE